MITTKFVNKRHLYTSISLTFFLIISFLLPMVYIKNLGVMQIGYQTLILYTSQAFSSFNGVTIIISSLIWASLLSLLIIAILLIFKPSKPLLRLGQIFSLLLVVSLFLLMFTIKENIDSSAYIATPFLIKHLTIVYFIALLVALLQVYYYFKLLHIDFAYVILSTLSIIWIIPILWILLTSLRKEPGFYSSTFLPKGYTFNNYVRLFTDTSIFSFGRWFLNTLIVALGSCVITTFIIVSTSYVLSRIKFKARKSLMKLFLILGMFPGFMSMIAIYYVIKALDLSQQLFALILAYSGASALGYYIVKGFFDTIPTAIDEAAIIEGASRLKIFSHLTIPLSKPIIIYVIITSFIGPWGDYIFASVIMGDNYQNYTVALGLYKMLHNTYLDSWYTSFAAGAILIALPISILFIAFKNYYIEGLSGSVKG